MDQASGHGAYSAAYREYVRSPRCEFTCAKGAYVGTRCGWFSDRLECYLAAGRPVILQATGFEDLLPTGKGLFVFTIMDEAVEAIRAVRADYPLHSAAARQIALEHSIRTKSCAGCLPRRVSRE